MTNAGLTNAIIAHASRLPEAWASTTRCPNAWSR